ncbi:S9 family peptidase [Amycolatopsis granulosa]|uniref:S9 family peptidase n=1 Tax=Amycolatopsis granulosa TaxID=185684 RepID=UPI0014215139|nr:S9 family peptidase [Amycolatopsis granulosa]NIH84162.1 dipeptidyl aminopeptidase/acylaminoacyl peptidase [Amycolatopsis granulosa]
MRPSDLELVAVPGPPALHGTLLLTAVATPDLGGNTYRSALWRAHPDGGPARQWTHGERDSAPAISPDGRWVAFLRAEDKGRPQLHVMPADGGDARRITDLPLGAGAPVWAPDSRRIAFTARLPEPGRYGTPGEDGEVVEPDAEAPRRITRYDYRLDNVGFLRDRPSRLFVVDATDPGEPEPLTDDRADVSDPAWLPDGSALLVVAPREWGTTDTGESDLYRVPAGGGEPVLVVRTAGSAAKPAVFDDGTVYYYGAEFTWPHAVARNPGVWAAELPADGEPAKPRRLTDAESVYCAADVPPARFRDQVLVAVLNRGAVELRGVPRDADRVPLDGLDRLLGDRCAVRSFAVHGERIAAVVARPDSSGDVVLLDGAGQRVLTDFSEPLRGKGIRPAEELTATAPDGYPVHGWLVRPDGDGPHPVLLVVHGGPFAAYDWGLFDEAQVYASAGYAVVMGNPRGSAGYGESHGQAIVHGLGTVDVDDVLALLDAALAREDLDASRVGVMGGSYGGFMTTWLAAHHGSRFRAAWSERAVNAWDSFTGSSDIGWYFSAAYVGADPVVQRDRSPLTYAHQIGIPFAVVHSEHDWRCPVEQAQRLFVELKRNGAAVEMLLFPGEGHELSRSGKPRHRLQRFASILEWWSRHLS